MAPRATIISTPSTILTDAINALSKTANIALATVEEQAKVEVTRAQTEATDARRERDEAVQSLHNVRMQEKEWEHHIEAWKTSIEKSELTIKHHSETIAQLRAEAHQWKTQLLRLEETSRREAQDWKEQYLRAEQERIKLAARLDELVTEQLQVSSNGIGETVAVRYAQSGAPAPTYSSRLGAVDNDSPQTHRPLRPTTHGTARQARKPKSLSSKPLSSVSDRERTYVEGMPRQPTPKRVNAIASSSKTTRRKSIAGALKDTSSARVSQTSVQEREFQRDYQVQPVRQRLIRRVHAVVEVPVKEEEHDDEDVLTNDLDYVESASDEDERYVRKTHQTKLKRRLSVKSQSRIFSDSDDDDELIMGAEDNAQEIYGTQRVVVTSEVNAPKRPRTSIASSVQSSENSKKRKVDTGASSTSTAATKVIRKKPAA